MKTIDRDIVEKFYENFSKIKDRPIVIYGVGEKTKLILQECSDFNIIGLMDKEEIGMKYGLPILQKQEVIQKAYCIIIVCALHNLDVIYSRIQSWTTDNDILVFHLNGKLLKMSEKKNISDSIKSIELYKKSIDEHDIISFDLFDTLVMRQVLYPADIWDMISCKLGEKKFKENRRQAEMLALKKYGEFYNLQNIYEQYVLIVGSSTYAISYLEELEIQVEVDNVLPRYDVVSLLEYAHKQGKKILLTSDMYLSKNSIIRILNKCGIDYKFFSNIYISNECLMSKSNGEIWKHILNTYDDKEKILHLGDNEVSDIAKAFEAGIEALPTYSGLKLALTVLDNEWLNYEQNFSERFVMGRFISQIFNSPFCINENGVIEINSLKDIGNYFFGPVVKCFMDKLYCYAKQKKQTILFQARDCWILKEIADKYYKQFDIDSIYLLTSRRQIALASIRSKVDIEIVCDVFLNSCKYTFSKFCKVIFGIAIRNNDKYFDILVSDISKADLKKHLILYYKGDILNEAKHQRKCFNKYLSQLKLKDTDKLAIVNFVGSGGTQLFFEKYGFKEYCEYYYFALAPLRVELEDLSKIVSIYGASSNFTGTGNAIAEKTMIGECIFTSPKSQFMGFDSYGKFDFSDDGINYNYEKIKECHEGICEYIDSLCKYDFDYREVSPQLINIVYSYMFNRDYLCVSNVVKEAFSLKDIVKNGEKYNPWV